MTRRILVIDDSTTIQKVIRIAFAPFDVRVEAANNFMEALSAIHQLQPEVLLIDATLPGAQVPRDFRRLQDEARGAPVIILCGSFDEVNEGALRGAGFSALVNKPFDSNDIVGKVKHVLGGELGRRSVGASGQNRPVDGTASGLGAVPSKRANNAVDREVPVNPDLYELAREETELQLDPGLLNDGRRVGERAFESAKEAPQAPRPTARINSSWEGAMPKRDTPPVAPPTFDLDDETSTEWVSVPPSGQPQPERVRGVLEPAMREELAKLVREQVEEYCARHFQSLAREVITAEIRRLTEEKSRHLVDN